MRQICFKLQFNFTFRNSNNATPFIPYTIMHIVFKKKFNLIFNNELLYVFCLW